jgi:hypothetical protein
MVTEPDRFCILGLMVGSVVGPELRVKAGVETPTSIIKHLKVRMCAPGGIGGGQGGGMISMKHSAIILKRPGAVHTYLPKCQCVLKYKALRS